MYYFNQNTRINLEWKVMKGVGGEAEDFSGANVWLFLYGRHRVIPVAANGMTGESKVCAVIPEGLPEDVYSMQLVWTKNECRGAGNCLMRSSKEDVFSIISGASGPVGEPTISITTTATTYGYDGLSSYELAVMLGKTTLDRDSWVENAAEANANVQALRAEVTAFFNLNDRVQALEDEVFGGNIAETTTVAAGAQTIEVGVSTRFWVAPSPVFSVPAGKTITCEGNEASETFPLLYVLVDGEYILVAQGDEPQSVSWTNIGTEAKDVYAGSGYNKGAVNVTVNRDAASLAEKIEAAKTEAEQEASSALAQEASLRQGADNLLQALINGKVIDSPESGFQEHDKTVSGYALKAYLDSAFTTEKNQRVGADTALGERIDREAMRATYAENALGSRVGNVEGVIPAQATAGNQLADKNFVNSSIATATATFRGTYNVVTDLSLSAAATHAQIELALKTRLPNVDKNDYCFVQIPTTTEVPTQIAVVERYKYAGSEWGYEWSLNNSSFTAAQWAAINSGITASLIQTFNAKYNKPAGGIPASDMTSEVQNILNNANSIYFPNVLTSDIREGELTGTIKTKLITLRTTAQELGAKLVTLKGGATYVVAVIETYGSTFNMWFIEKNRLCEVTGNADNTTWSAHWTDMSNGTVYDISVAHPDGQGNPTPYADLTAALGTNGVNVPEGLRKGGMSVKFVQTSDNKYVQYRCVADEFTTDTTKWAIYSESVYVNDPFYVKVYTDANDRIILAITKEGDIKFGVGVPTQIVDYINSKVDELSSDVNERIEDIESIIGTLNETFSFTDDHIWLNVTLDSDGHIVEGVRKDGTKYIAKYDDNIQKLLSDVPTYNDVKKHEGLEVEKRVITYSKTTPENTPDFNNLSNNLLIAFMTDTHIDLGNKEASYNNVKDTISFLNNLHAPIAAIIEGGDVVTPYSSRRETHKEIMAPFFSRIKDAKMPVLYTKGNHDINAIETVPSQVLTDDDWGEVYFNWAEENYGIVRHTKSNGKKSGYYYYDLEDWKVRIICADCNDLPFDTVDSRGRVLYQPGASTYIAQEQFDWIVNTALNFDDKDDKGWGVILFTHFYRATDVNGTSYAPIYASVYPAFNRMLAAFNSQSTFDEEYTFAENHFFDLDVHGDWTRYSQLDNKPFVICVLSGHVHTDQNYVKDGINNIWTANQFCGDYPADRRIIRIAGSNTQNLFDIISIDLLHRKIRAIRYGAGVTCFGEGGDRFIDNGLSF